MQRLCKTQIANAGCDCRCRAPPALQIANACGVPVVATPVGSFPEQLALDARNIVVKSVDISSILDGIIEVLTSNSSGEIGDSPPDAVLFGWTNYLASINARIH